MAYIYIYKVKRDNHKISGSNWPKTQTHTQTHTHTHTYICTHRNTVKIYPKLLLNWHVTINFMIKLSC